MRNLEELYDATQVMEDTTLFYFHADSDPLSFNEAVTEEKWIKAMDEEIHAIEKNDTWKLTNPPKKRESNRCQMCLQDEEECKRRSAKIQSQISG